MRGAWALASLRLAIGAFLGQSMKHRFLQLDARDNVLVALTDLPLGESISFAGDSFPLVAAIPAKHKFALRNLGVGDDVLMYGMLVGKATEPIPRGGLLTTRNLHHETSAYHGKTSDYAWTPPDISRWRNRTFLGYRRSDGQTGTRNYWLVVPLVFCENRNILVLKQALEEELGFAPPQLYRRQVADLAQRFREGRLSPGSSAALSAIPPAARPPLFEHVDGIRFLLHEGGCGGTREDSRNLCGLIAGYLHHPNVAGATILSLGCQHAQIALLREELQKRAPGFDKPLVILEQQQSGSEAQMLSEAIEKTFLGLVEADRARRTEAPLSALTLGLKCGGSDGFSGISANPAIGHTSDLLAALGGRSLLSEFPELCGAEQSLIDRCASPELADRFATLMRNYDNRARAVGSGFEMNPSPGNMRDGLLTDAMKSAGAAKKGGTSPVTHVLDYPEYSSGSGLQLQCTPGNDVECVTAQVGAGASVVLFTTGLGTPTGNPVAPVIKLSTNSDLARRMPDIIDIDTGPVISGDLSINQMGEQVLDLVIRVASGEVRTRAEQKGQEDFIPWKRGVSL